MNSKKEQQKQEIPNEENLNEEIKSDDKSTHIEDFYKFGWSKYSELTNGRFAMLGFLAIILVELISQKPFLHWAGIQ